MGYRYIKLTSAEIEALEEASKSSTKHHVRRKCDALLLSARGYDITSLSERYEVRTHTIRAWMDKWLSEGLQGFFIGAGRGRKPEIELTDTVLVDAIKLAVELNPQNLEVVCAELNQSNNIHLTKGKLLRFLKKS
jgi:transposase